MGDLYRHWGKRALDIGASAGALLILAPVIAGVALLVWVQLGAPVLFRQQRPGLRGRPFRILKFRTMTEARDAQGGMLPDGERLSPFGRVLRQWSLDELPELWNVLRGDLSLVGPRPLLMQYLARYTPAQARRHEVRPGITGWSQVNGRNAVTWQQRLEHDVWYIDHLSFWLDLKILTVTLWRVLTRQGINSPGHATMPGFGGGDDQGGEPDAVSPDATAGPGSGEA